MGLETFPTVWTGTQVKKVFGAAGDELVVEQLLIGEEFLVKEMVLSKYHEHFMKMSGIYSYRTFFLFRFTLGIFGLQLCNVTMTSSATYLLIFAILYVRV